MSSSLLSTTTTAASAAHTPIRVAIARDHDLVVEGLRSMLRPYGDRIVLVEAGARPAAGPPPDLLLCDPLTGPLQRGGGRAVVYTWDVDAAMDVGPCSGLVSKTLSAGDLVEALERIHQGQPVVARGPAHGAASQPAGAGRWLGQDVGLSERESEVLGHIATGVSNNEVAELAFLSINTVKSYVRSTYRKIGVETRSQAVLWAVEHGFRPDRPLGSANGSSTRSALAKGSARFS